MPNSDNTFPPLFSDTPNPTFLYTARVGFHVPFKALVYFLTHYLDFSPDQVVQNLQDKTLKQLERLVAKGLSKKLKFLPVLLGLYFQELREIQDQTCSELLDKEWGFSRTREWRTTPIKATTLRLYTGTHPEQAIQEWIEEYRLWVQDHKHNQLDKKKFEKVAPGLKKTIESMVTAKMKNHRDSIGEVVQTVWQGVCLVWTSDIVVREERIKQCISRVLKAFFDQVRREQKLKEKYKRTASIHDVSSGLTQTIAEDIESTDFDLKIKKLMLQLLFSKALLPHESLCLAGAKMFDLTQHEILKRWKDKTLSDITGELKGLFQETTHIPLCFTQPLLESFTKLLDLRLTDVVQDQRKANSYRHVALKVLKTTYLKDYLKKKTPDSQAIEIGHWIDAARDKIKTKLFNLEVRRLKALKS